MAKFPPLIESLPCPAALLSRSGEVKFASREWAKLFGEKKVSSINGIREVLEGKTLFFTIESFHPPGDFLFRANEVDDGYVLVGNPIGAVQTNKNKEREAIRHLLNHELTGLTCAARYHLDKIAKKPSPEDESKAVTRLSLVLQTIEETLFESSQLFPLDNEKLQTHSLVKIAEAAVDSVSLKNREGVVSVRGDWTEVFCFKKKMTKAIRNLVENALKYAKPKNGEALAVLIDVFVPSDDDEKVVCVKVSDNGQGVREEDSRTLFDAFFRGGGSEQVPGSGLGLYLVKAIAEEHGGSCGYEDRVGGGSVFWIRIPAYAS